jgi:hypothetical protein
MAALTMVAAIGLSAVIAAQSSSPAEMAARLTGNWKLNADLTPAAPASGRGRGGRDRAPAFAVAMPAQRGGGGGGAGRGGAGRGDGFGGGAQPGGESAPLTPDEVAEQAALSVLHEVPTELAIEASAEAVTFRDPRGEWHFNIDGRNTSMDVPGGALRTKSKWDHNGLRQEFSSGHRKLTKTWSLDAGGRLVLTERIESLTFNSESKAVFDRR